MIRKIVLATREVTTLAGGANYAGYADATGGLARFYTPEGMSTDGAYLYVADYDNRRIRRVDPASGEVTTFAGTGAAAHNDGPAVSAAFQGPLGIATDGPNLYVTDIGGNQAWIRKINLATGVVSTIAGGSAGYQDGPMPRFGQGTLGITNDGTKLLIGDGPNQVVRFLR